MASVKILDGKIEIKPIKNTKWVNLQIEYKNVLIFEGNFESTEKAQDFASDFFLASDEDYYFDCELAALIIGCHPTTLIKRCLYGESGDNYHLDHIKVERTYYLSNKQVNWIIDNSILDHRKITTWDGVQYPSIADAARAQEIEYEMMYWMVRLGIVSSEQAREPQWQQAINKIYAIKRNRGKSKSGAMVLQRLEPK